MATSPDNRGSRAAPIAAGAASLAAAVGLIIAAVVDVEGGYVDNPNDPGGKTNHGITEATARTCGYRGDMRALTEAAARDCYDRLYVSGPGFDGVVAMDPWVGKKLVDVGVNTGTGRAGRWFQESVNHYNRRGADYADISVDGQVGPATLRAFDALRAKRGAVLACQLMIKAVEAKQANHYLTLSERDGKFETFTIGWMDHRVGNVPVSRCGTRFQ